MPSPLAYFITFTTYGSWLHFNTKGSVDRQHNIPGTPFLPSTPTLHKQQHQALRQPPYHLDHEKRLIVLQTICEVAEHRKWLLWAVHVRSNHVHIVIRAEVAPEKVMSDLKAWCSRRLRESLVEDPDRDRWTQHGSTRYLNNQKSLERAIDYVLNQQGDSMEIFDGRSSLRHESEGL